MPQFVDLSQVRSLTYRQTHGRGVHCPAAEHSFLTSTWGTHLSGLNRQPKLIVEDPKLRQTTHMVHIQNKLEEFLSARDARETATKIYDRLLEVDYELDRILRDPVIRKLYEYDGRFFTPKRNWGFFRAFDGIHVLRSLSDETLETFFRGREQYLAIQWLMEELGKHAWEAKVRRMNWEESGTLSVVSKEVLDEILRRIRQSEIQDLEKGAPLSLEERTFFQSFEDQMASRR